MEGSIVLRILEGRTVLEKERCKRTVLKEWKRCLVQEGVRKKQTEVEEKRRLREFRRVLEALRLRKKLKIEFKNFTEKRELNLKEEILNEFKKVRKESKFLKYVFLKNSTKMDRFKQSIAFETWRNSTLATKRQQNNLKKLACMKLAKITPDLNSAFQTLKVTTHCLSLQPKRLLNLLRKHQRHRLLPSFSKWKQVAEFHKIEKIQSEAGPKAIALRNSRIEQASLNSLLKAETRTYALPLIRDGLKKKAFFALKTYAAKVRLLNSQFSCPKVVTVKEAFAHWKLLSKKKINTTRSHLEDRIANASHKTVCCKLQIQDSHSEADSIARNNALLTSKIQKLQKFYMKKRLKASKSLLHEFLRKWKLFTYEETTRVNMYMIDQLKMRIQEQKDKNELLQQQRSDLDLRVPDSSALESKVASLIRQIKIDKIKVEEKEQDLEILKMENLRYKEEILLRCESEETFSFKSGEEFTDTFEF
ncbi:unnamed protein product [Moneuplotes crassus]|uniref:Uncharacterized protein n=1 Tax=Euplotes crassus TaxID=5936 RepID=A0AAD1YA68_EUPCR|nr:unnamed protein product [Moneuplotes crassus]